ncbi:4'-phosphopantetheinyl transferase [Vibrio gazogenes]|uniref:Enterobactin synthase component D n=1 Tax=Vibrio gazogenes DSM 21264 = NBRC 103151 TaxID=1123492 RepID=A0A1M5BTS0_VIBGA|nr:4'-phosphopantetheinyl transferase superfamily protein [Vibrio gazogenes]USP13660.1 4'-phosphopantetheinyl transferase superfamily protein [Vibrio gazogenes]SHF45835.1 enterobactin synthetase component D [Vibrio gazogenes DSM 21264] [Vibrio gazogenes DSM 21264 = NBRC 103151]SJN55740.1 4'-phosphopantetheinyl transferase Npt [Vibrio gazogenes]
MTFLIWQKQLCLGGQTLFMNRYVRDKYTAGAAQEGITLPESLLGAVTKRKAEFVAGRVAAKYALLHRGASEPWVGIGEHRSPVWPDGFIGSISHTDDTAISTVATKAERLSIGVDVENIMDETLCESIGRMIVTSEEIKLQDVTGWYKAPFMSLMFSAKESLFKALYPLVKRYLDFHDAQLISLEPQHSHFTFELSPILQQQTGIQFCHGHYLFLEDALVTLIQIERDA